MTIKEWNLHQVPNRPGRWEVRDRDFQTLGHVHLVTNELHTVERWRAQMLGQPVTVKDFPTKEAAASFLVDGQPSHASDYTLNPTSTGWNVHTDDRWVGTIHLRHDGSGWYAKHGPVRVDEASSDNVKLATQLAWQAWELLDEYGKLATFSGVQAGKQAAQLLRRSADILDNQEK